MEAIIIRCCRPSAPEYSPVGSVDEVSAGFVESIENGRRLCNSGLALDSSCSITEGHGTQT